MRETIALVLLGIAYLGLGAIGVSIVIDWWQRRKLRSAPCESCGVTQVWRAGGPSPVRENGVIECLPCGNARRLRELVEAHQRRENPRRRLRLIQGGRASA